MNRLESAATLRRLADELEARPHMPSRPVELMAEGLVAIAVGVLEQLGRAAPLRVCEWCGKPLRLNKRASGWEPQHEFQRRRFCDRQCSARAREAKNARARREAADLSADALPGGALGQAVREAGAARRREAQAKPRRERKPSRPTPTPRPQPTPRREPSPAKPDPKPAPVTAGAPRVHLPDPRPQPAEVAHPVTLGEPCPKHPSYTLGVYGCQACNAGRRWAESQRQVAARPHLTTIASRIE